MLRRILFIVSLVIVLVSLNWFSKLLAADMSNLTAEQRQALLKQLGSQPASQVNSDYWETPQIYLDNEHAARKSAAGEGPEGLPVGQTIDTKNNALIDANRRPDLLAKTVSESEMELGRAAQNPPTGSPARIKSSIQPAASIPRPPSWGSRVVRAMPLELVARHLSRNELFRLLQSLFVQDVKIPLALQQAQDQLREGLRHAVGPG